MRLGVDVPGLSWACHSPSVFCTGKLLEAMLLAEVPNFAPRKGIVKGIERATVMRLGACEKLRAVVLAEAVLSVRKRILAEEEFIKGIGEEQLRSQ